MIISNCRKNIIFICGSHHILKINKWAHSKFIFQKLNNTVFCERLKPLSRYSICTLMSTNSKGTLREIGYSPQYWPAEVTVEIE